MITLDNNSDHPINTMQTRSIIHIHIYIHDYEQARD